MTQIYEAQIDSRDAIANASDAACGKSLILGRLRFVSAAEEQPADVRILQKFAARTGLCELSGH